LNWQDQDNPFRDIIYIADTKDAENAILQDNAQYQKTMRWEYFARMSEALAYSCTDYAAVLTPDPNNIPQDGIWAKRELPALKLTGKVAKVGIWRTAKILYEGRTNSHIYID